MFELLFKYPAGDYARSTLVFTGDWPAWLIPGLAAAGSAVIVVLLVKQRDASTLSRVIVGGLQVAVLLIVLCLLAQPALRSESLKPGQNSLALVLDGSSSMRYGPERPRVAAARERLDQAAAELESLDLELRRYVISDTAQRLDDLSSVAADGETTDLASSLRGVLEEARSTSLAAVVLASDGIDTTGGLSSRELADIADYGIPVFTIAVGREQIPEDLELSRLLVPKRALPGSTLAANLTIRHDAGGMTRVTVYDGDELLVSTPVELAADASTTRVTIDVDEPARGYRELVFSVDPLEGEPELRNNRRTALVAVEDRPRRVLYFEGEPRWEYKFMRRAVAGEEQVELVSLLRVSANKFYRQGLETAEELEDGFPDSRQALFGYDALIIGSVESAAFTPAQLAIIEAFVNERGGSLLLLAGPRGLGNGGWGQSAIADILPVRLPPSTENSFFRTRVAATLTPQGAAVEMLRLDADTTVNRQRWAELPAIADYQLTGATKPAATTLLTAATEDGDVPLLVRQPFGRGQAWILATGGTWRWQMSLPAEDQRHETFWRQLLRALVTGVPDPVRFSATPAGQGLELRAEFRDAAFNPLRDLEVTATVSHASGDSLDMELLPSPGEPGVFRASVDSTRPGTWYAEAIARRGEDSLATARTAVRADPAQAEHFSLRSNRPLLERLSEATGGRAIGPDEIDLLPGLVAYSGSGIAEAVYRPLWDAPILLLALLATKLSEWLLRRRWRTI